MVSSTNPIATGAKGLFRRRVGSIGSLSSITTAFCLGIFVSYMISRNKISSYLPSDSAITTKLKQFEDFTQVPESPIFDTAQPEVVHSDTSAPDGFINAWKQNRETCEQWLSMQTLSQSYLDAYIIGSQKGATSTITRRFHNLEVKPPTMQKEWHYFNKLDENGTLTKDITSHKEVLPGELKRFRYEHYKAGFPDDKNATIDQIPGIDRRNISERVLAYDGTVEHFHTDKAAFLAHALTPHAKIVATVRNPIDRALSQFNMVVRSYNKGDKARGRPTRPATPEWFHEVVKDEIERIAKCGYNAEEATIDRPTSRMLACLFGEGKVKFENLLYVTRGLYHIHVATWRNYFPDHRILILSFSEITTGQREPHEALTKFLCIRPFSEEDLEFFKENGSTMSFGQQVARGMENKGVDAYDNKNDSYLLDIDPKTRTMLNDFYRPANVKLEALLGRKMYDYE